MTDRELMQMALEALVNGTGIRTFAVQTIMANTAQALRARLAQPDSEPVAWMYERHNYPESRSVEQGVTFNKPREDGRTKYKPLYKHPACYPSPLVEALKAAHMALLEASPCAWEECKQTQSEMLDWASNKVGAALEAWEVK